MAKEMSVDLTWFFPTAAVDENGLYASRRLDDGRWLCVEPMLYQRARLAISCGVGATVKEALNTGFGYADVWEYETREAAIVAMEMWDGTPTGWTRWPTNQAVFMEQLSIR